ncbi:MAG: hypothetical protein KKG92_11425, partial [Gammaproteobacteria bacterium]|nr:hypothetical protein [Gammaproteobacteria bacterium]
MTWLLIALLAWPLLVSGLLFVWRKPLLALWREPVFKAPILIVESDDWGAGPLVQAEALAAIAECLARQRDASGRPAVMTLALVLAVPGPAMEPGRPWRRQTLADPALHPILEAIRAGQACGVFALQLHGMEHFWPESLLAAAQENAEVATWLAAPELTEHLPSPLQSRWTDAAVLPSRPLSRQAVEAAVAEETRLYAALFGAAPDVVVPPTFVWTEDVEA